ncbi:hypothetical protein COD69_18815 [Bacillus thuringiensis]|nr:hypothetical protein COD69_18815 [Bacillus thuringiensis]
MYINIHILRGNYLFGPTIEKIREGKKIKIKDLCDGIVSRAAYHRFAIGQSDTSILNLSLFMDRLQISPDEFFLIHNNYASDKIVSFLKELSRAYRVQDLQGIRSLRSKLEADFTGVKKEHLTELLNFRICRLVGKDVNGENSELFKYLVNTEFWTHYELVLFTNSMYVFSLELIDALLVRCIQNFKKYSQVRPYGNESFRLVVNALILSFEQKNSFYTNKWVDLLGTIELNDSDFFEKTLSKIFKGFYEININNNRKNISEIIKTIEFVGHIEADEHEIMFTRMLDYILEHSDVEKGNYVYES